MLKLESSRYVVVLSVIDFTHKGVSTRHRWPKNAVRFVGIHPRGTTICRRHLSEADTHEQ